ncbi:MAG: sugar ABC transporter substrate-binding protein [Acidimicrobiales bacterium]
MELRSAAGTAGVTSGHLLDNGRGQTMELRSAAGTAGVMRKRPVAAFGAAALCAGLALSACSASSSHTVAKTSSSAAASSSSVSASAGVQRAKAFVGKYVGVPTEPSVGPSFDAKAAAGKLIYLIPIQLAGFNKTIVDTAQAAAQQLGAKAVIWPSTGTLSDYQQGVEAAINAGANIICLEGVDPQLISPQLAAARAKGIKITLDIFGNGSSPLPAGFSGGVNMPFSLGGELEADYAIMATKGHVDALVLTSDDIPQTPDVLKGLHQAFQENCRSCTLHYVNETVPTWPNFGSATAAALREHPNVNYVIPLYDNYAQFALSGISLAGASQKVHMDTLNGTPSVLSEIKPGAVVQMDIGVSAVWLGYAEITNALRVATGGQPTVVAGVPRVFTTANVAQAGSPPSFATGYGVNIEAQFKKVWGI